MHGFRQQLDPSWTQVFVYAFSCFRIGDITGTIPFLDPWALQGTYF
jgi:hypothetical protein